MMRRLVTYGLLALMVGFAVFFSITIFATNSLRLDEAQSLFQVNRDVPGMLYLIGQDVHVPLYHIILHFWVMLFGESVFTARMLSLVFFAGTILMTYLVATYAFGRRSIGLFAALLVTISPFMNWYGSEVRMYTMLAFMTTLHSYLLLKALREPSAWRWVAWAAIAAVGVYTHYFFIFVLLAEFVAVLLLRKKFTSQHPIRAVVIGDAAAGLTLLPWVLYVLQLGFAGNTQPALSEPSAGDLFDTYAQFIFGFQTPAINTAIISLWPIAVLLGFFALQRSNRKIPTETLVFVLLATVPVIAAFIVSVTIRPFYLSRYLIVALPALLIFISWLLTRYRRSVAIAIRVALVAIVGFLFVVQAVSPETPVKEDYRETVEFLEAKAQPTDVIILSAPFTIYPIEYYYNGTAKLTTQPIWDRFSSGGVPAYDAETVAEETEANVGSYQRAWLVLSYDQGYNDDIRQYYDEHFERLSEKRFSPGLVVYEYKTRYDPQLKIGD